VETQGTGLNYSRGRERFCPTLPLRLLTSLRRKNSVIVRLIVLAGLPHVREGQTVVAGQVLVSAKEPSGGAGSVVHARAIIEGRVWREGRGRVPLIVEQRVRTGRKAVQYRIVCGNIDFKLGRGRGLSGLTIPASIEGTWAFM